MEVGVFFLVAFFTVIRQVALTFLLPFDVAVIVVEPTFFAFTIPFLLTVATDFLLDFQVTFLEALDGFTFFTFKVNFCPTVNVFFFAFSLICLGFDAALISGVTEKAEIARAIETKTAHAFCILFFMIPFVSEVFPLMRLLSSLIGKVYQIMSSYTIAFFTYLLLYFDYKFYIAPLN